MNSVTKASFQTLPKYGPATSLSATDELARTNLALPIGPVLSEAEVAEVVRAVAQGAS